MKLKTVLVIKLGFLASACVVFPHALAAPTPVSRMAQQVRDDARSLGNARFTAPDYKPGIIRHMVMFRFKSSATQAERKEVTKRFVALRTLSRRPDGNAVVATIESGPQISGENADLGLEQGYLVTFRSQGDRNFYVGRPIVTDSHCLDPAHDAFKIFAGPYLERVVVFDFPVEASSQP